MTINSLTVLVTGAGNGSDTAFSFSPITIYAPTDLEVIHVATDGTETALSEGSGASAYSVQVSSFPGTGTVTYPADQVTPMASGESIVIKINTSLIQPSRFRNQAPYDPQVLEIQLDKIVRMIQSLNEIVQRTVRAKISEDGITSFDLPAPTAGKGLRWNDAGTGFANTTDDIDSIASTAVGARDAALAAQAAAETAETNAETHETNAETAETNAEAAAAQIVGWEYENEYEAGTVYATNNIVFHAATGASYISLQNSNQGNTPAFNGGSGTAFWGVLAQQGAAGAGSGDLIAANNLSDVDSAATSFANIKQPATESATGVLEKATTAEVVTGTDTDRAVTPAGVQAALNGGTILRTAAANMGDQELLRPNLRDYKLQVSAHGSMGASETFDYEAANIHTGTLSANLTSITLSNWAASGDMGRLELIITQDGSSAFTITWPAAIVWADGTEPDLSTLSSVTHIVLVTLDGGTTVYGYRAGGNFA